MSVLRKHCDGDLTVCDFANLCGLGKAAFWIFCLLPQLILNWRRKSVDGLSVLWAASMFTASFVHAFYVFNKDKYVFYKISLILMPVMRLALLVQFWAYSRHTSQLKLSFAAGCVVFYGAVLTLELSVPHGSAARLEWIAVVFFSIELIPQIVVNLMNRSTVGQATPSVILSAVAELLGFLYYYLLTFPSQFQIMQFFTASTAFLNLMQVFWYPRPDPPKKRKVAREYGATSTEEETYPAEESVANGTGNESGQGSSQFVVNCEEPQVVLTALTPQQLPSVRDRILQMPKGILFLFMCLSLGLVGFSVSLCIVRGSIWALLAPISLLLVLATAVLYRSYREGTLPCIEPAYPQVHYKAFKQ